MKYVIGLNLFLALFFAIMATLLYQDIESMKVAKNTDTVYEFTEFARKPVVPPEKWRDIFGATQEDAAAAVQVLDTSSPNDADSGKPFQGKIRLRGIFIYNDVRKAVISIDGSKGQEKQPEQQRLTTCKTGDTIEGFAVTRILPDRIVLTSQSLESVTIMVYKPLTISGKNE